MPDRQNRRNPDEPGEQKKRQRSQNTNSVRRSTTKSKRKFGFVKLYTAVFVFALTGFLYSCYEAIPRFRDLWSIDQRLPDHRVRTSRIQLDGNSVRIENDVVVTDPDFVKACHKKATVVYRFFDKRVAVISSDQVESFPEAEIQRFKPALEYLRNHPMGEETVYDNGMRLSQGAHFTNHGIPIPLGNPTSNDRTVDVSDEYPHLISVMLESEHNNFASLETDLRHRSYAARKRPWTFPYGAVTTTDIVAMSSLLATFFLLIGSLFAIRISRDLAAYR